MSDEKKNDWQENLDRRVKTAQNLVWIAGGLLAITIAIAGWTANQLSKWEGQFVKYDAEIRISHISSGAKYFMVTEGSGENSKLSVITQPEGDRIWKVEKP